LSLDTKVQRELLRGNVDGRPDKRPMLSDLRANVMGVWSRKNRLDGPSGERCELFWRGAMMRCYEMAMKGMG